MKEISILKGKLDCQQTEMTTLKTKMRKTEELDDRAKSSRDQPAVNMEKSTMCSEIIKKPMRLRQCFKFHLSDWRPVMSICARGIPGNYLEFAAWY